MDIRTQWYDELDSTNAEAQRLAAAGAAEGLLVVADTQRAGRGRRGRSWNSPPGDSISMTFLLRPEVPPDTAPVLTLVTALSVAEAINESKQVHVGIKWPNDLVIGGRKLCGILTEMQIREGRIDHVVIGIGINVNTKEFPGELQKTATSLFIENGHPTDRKELIQQIGTHFAKEYEQFCAEKGFSSFRGRYEQLSVNLGQEVQVLTGNERYFGRAEGINEWGELLITREDGTKEAIRAGEVSVRGIYGYT